MNCPNCGKEMEKGRLYGSVPLIWTPEDTKRLLIRKEGEVNIIDGAFPEAHICKDCRKVMVDY